MRSHIDLFDSTYRNFSEQVLQEIRQETFGRDIGQNSRAFLKITASATPSDVRRGSAPPFG